MTNLEETLDWLERMESKGALRDLIAYYATTCYQHDMAKLMSLFSEGAEYDSPNGSMKC